MAILYQARLEDPLGNHLATFENFVDPTDGGGAGLDYILNVGKPSVLLLTVPSTTDLDLFHYDGRITPYRSIHGRGFYNDNAACYLIRKRRLTDRWFRFTAYHANSLFDRRVVAYDSGTTFANKTAVAAGNQIKAFARENLGSSVDASRDQVTGADLVTPGYLVIDANNGDGASVAKYTSRGRMNASMNDIADDSTTGGTYLGFNILYGTDKKFYLTTRPNQWGLDKRAGNADQVIFSAQRGNIANWYIDEDRSEEVTVSIAGGRGQNDERVIATAVDLRDNISPFRYMERYFDAPSADDAASVQAVANANLRQYQPKITFQADLVEAPNATRGIHYDWGDIVTAEAFVQGQSFRYDCRIDLIYVSVRKGSQRSRVSLESPL